MLPNDKLMRDTATDVQQFYSDKLSAIIAAYKRNKSKDNTSLKFAMVGALGTSGNTPDDLANMLVEAIDRLS